MHNNNDTETQTPEGKRYQRDIIGRILRLTVYVPKGSLDANKIRAVDKSTLIRYVIEEGYGK